MVRIDFDKLNSLTCDLENVLYVLKLPDRVEVGVRGCNVPFSYYTSAPEVAFAKVLEAFNEDD